MENKNSDEIIVKFEEVTKQYGNHSRTWNLYSKKIWS